jgi:hypothetical protein
VIIAHAKPDKDGETQAKWLYLVNCETTATNILSIVSYGAKDHVLSHVSTDPKDSKPDYYPPESMGHTAVEALCKPEFGP